MKRILLRATAEALLFAAYLYVFSLLISLAPN